MRKRTLKRMGEVLRIRGYSPRTVDSYVSRASGFLNYSPYPVNQVDQDLVHDYLVHLKDERKLVGSTINQTLPNRCIRKWPNSTIQAA